MSITQQPSTVTIDQLGEIADGDGAHHHFLNHLATVKVGAGESVSGMNAVEFTAPRGFGPPLHVHREEDELMYVIDGRVRLEFGDETVYAERGSVVSLPCGIPHTFQVESETARMLTVAAGRRSAPSFDRFVATLGDPTEDARIPEPGPIDPGHVAAVCADHGMEVLGPPPAPLD
ncbi:MAG: cupin domain-containing protein [Ilumatobacter sp.]|nr:cupin domain-containing protein [Ilumatobacter sp.]